MIYQSVFQDEVIRATELNRSSSEILNKAAKAPLTIIRNDEAFALMRRDVAATWQRESCNAFHVAEITVLAMVDAETLATEYKWIGAFDGDDRLRMTKELIAGYREGLAKGEWGNFEAILHEWSESGWAALSREHKAAFSAPDESVAIDSGDGARVERTGDS